MDVEKTKAQGRGHWGETFDALVKVLERDRYVEDEVEGWPWVKLRNYPRAGTADSAGNRIRTGRVRLPDVDGGDAGRWDAWVKRKVKGAKGRNGPAELWVRYLGGVGNGEA